VLIDSLYYGEYKRNESYLIPPDENYFYLKDIKKSKRISIGLGVGLGVGIPLAFLIALIIEMSQI
jgi:hypothetical protein